MSDLMIVLVETERTLVDLFEQVRACSESPKEVDEVYLPRIVELHSYLVRLDPDHERECPLRRKV